MEGLRHDSSFLGPGAHPMPRWEKREFAACHPLCSCGELCPQAGQGKGELGGCTVRVQDSCFNSLSLGLPLEKNTAGKKEAVWALILLS